MTVILWNIRIGNINKQNVILFLKSGFVIAKLFKYNIQFSVLHDPSGSVLICLFSVQETFIISMLKTIILYICLGFFFDEQSSKEQYRLKEKRSNFLNYKCFD